MKKTIVSLAMMMAASFAVAADSNTKRDSEDYLGICITNIVYQSDGIVVDFETDVPPPYRVGIHRPQELGYSMSRAFPVAYVDTNDKHVFVPFKIYDATVFVQVYDPTDKRIVPPWTRKMTDAEWANYVSRVRRHPIKTILDPDKYDTVVDNNLMGLDHTVMRLVGHNLWNGFVMTNATEMTMKIDMLVGTNCVEYTYQATGRDQKVGKGFRISLQDNMIPPDISAESAYSAIPNMSQEVLIKRGWVSLSSNGKWKIATDWEGYPVMVPCTNAIPYRIYGEGL